MTDLLALAHRHLTQHGMTETEALAMLEVFTKGQGRDIAWSDTATSLRQTVAERIDRAAVGWMMAHRGCDAPPDSARERDGLAGGSTPGADASGKAENPQFPGGST